LGRLAAVVLSYGMMQVAVSRVVPATVGQQWANLRASIACVAVMYLAVWAVDAGLGATPDLVALVIDVGVGAVVYVVAALVLREPSLGEVRALLGKRLAAKAA